MKNIAAKKGQNDIRLKAGVKWCQGGKLGCQAVKKDI